MKTVIARSTAAVGTSFVGVLLLAGPVNAKDIGPGEPLPPQTSANACRNAIPEDQAACRASYGSESKPYQGPADLPTQASLAEVGPGTLGVVALGGIAIAGLVITTVAADRHREAARPA